MADLISAVAAGALGLILIYHRIKDLIAFSRELQKHREQRLALYALLLAIPLMVGSCVVLERAAGVSPHTEPSSYTLRQIVAVVFLVGYLAFVYWMLLCPELRERARVAAGRICRLCNRPIAPKRLRRPIMERDDQFSKLHWAYPCECGELTLFHADSYGYRPGRSAIDAVRTARQRCWRYDWVLDLDIKGFHQDGRASHVSIVAGDPASAPVERSHD